MKKYNTKPVDYTGCHPVIAEALKRGDEIECKVWDHKGGVKVEAWIYRYKGGSERPYRSGTDTPWKYAEPTPLKVKRIMPPERAIPKLIEDGYEFDVDGDLVGPGPMVITHMFEHFGKLLTSKGCDCYTWPSCVIEEVSEDE